MVTDRIYLDNAATSWPKPQTVYDAVHDVMTGLGAPAGRGAYQEADDVQRIIATCRRSIADLLGVANPNRVVFTFNGTDSLNLAIQGVVEPGDHVVSTILEHNSVLRPLHELQSRQNIDLTLVGCGDDTIVDVCDIEQAIRPETKLICMVHVSNVTGAIQHIQEVGRIAQERGILFLVDAAQSVGHCDVRPGEIGADLLAAPGHKGLFGPLGTGILYVREGVEKQLRSIRQGGTGSSSDSAEQPEELPEKYESGNLNVPGLAGLKAGVDFIREQDVETIRAHQLQLLKRLTDGIDSIDGANVLGPGEAGKRCGVMSFTMEGCDSRECAAMLDSAFRVQVRAGFHCAALMHEYLQTSPYGGAIRISPGWFNTADDIDTAIRAVERVASAMMA